MHSVGKVSGCISKSGGGGVPDVLVKLETAMALRCCWANAWAVKLYITSSQPLLLESFYPEGLHDNHHLAHRIQMLFNSISCGWTRSFLCLGQIENLQDWRSSGTVGWVVLHKRLMNMGLWCFSVCACACVCNSGCGVAIAEKLWIWRVG